MIRTSRLNFRLIPGIYLILAVLGGSGVAGYALVSYNAPFIIWLIAELMILHLAWSGTQAIALAVVGVLALIWGTTIFTPIVETSVLPGVPLDPAQLWAGQLLLNWLLANSLVFAVGFTSQWLRSTGRHKRQILTLVLSVANVGLSLAPIHQLLTR